MSTGTTLRTDVAPTMPHMVFPSSAKRLVGRVLAAAGLELGALLAVAALGLFSGPIVGFAHRLGRRGNLAAIFLDRNLVVLALARLARIPGGVRADLVHAIDLLAPALQVLDQLAAIDLRHGQSADREHRRGERRDKDVTHAHAFLLTGRFHPATERCCAREMVSESA